MAKKFIELDEITSIEPTDSFLVITPVGDYRYSKNSLLALMTKAVVGLPNVDNTSDIDKPISEAAQVALDNKTDIGHSHLQSDITGLQNALNAKAALIHGHTVDKISGLSALLDDKTNVGHKHPVSDINGLDEFITEVSNNNVGVGALEW